MLDTEQATNAYWDAVRDHIEHDDLFGGPVVDSYGSIAFRRTREIDIRCDRGELTSTYAWTVTDPATVAFVREHAGATVVDPMAGSGWWAHLLDQAGIAVLASDLNPPDGTKANNWHRGGSHVPVGRADAADAVALAPAAATLLLSWPPYDADIGARIVEAFRGDRIIYIGEGWGGCCGDDTMFELFERDFDEVAEHRPVQFYGMHDFVTIYQRKAGA